MLDLAAAGRFALLAGITLGVGAVAFRVAVLPRARRDAGGTAIDAAFLALAARRAATVAAVAGALSFGAAALLLAGQLAALGVEGADAVAMARPLLTGTTWGRAWLALAVLGAVLGAAGARARRTTARRGAWVVAGAAALGLCTVPAFMGHAAADERAPTLSVASDAVHVLGAGTWLGTLALLLVAALRTARAPDSTARAEAIGPLVRAFSPLALAGATAVAASGAASGWLRVTGGGLAPWDALTTTLYGRLLLAKIAAVAVIVALGAHNWRRLTPRLDVSPGHAPDQAAQALRASVVRELLVAVVVLLLTAVLVATPPPGME